MKYSQWYDRKKLVSQGLCGRCRKPRGENGTTIHCRICADKASAYVREHRHQLKDQKICIA